MQSVPKRGRHPIVLLVPVMCRLRSVRGIPLSLRLFLPMWVVYMGSPVALATTAATAAALAALACCRRMHGGDAVHVVPAVKHALYLSEASVPVRGEMERQLAWKRGA